MNGQAIQGGSWALGHQFARSACREPRVPSYRNRRAWRITRVAGGRPPGGPGPSPKTISEIVPGKK